MYSDAKRIVVKELFLKITLYYFPNGI